MKALIRALWPPSIRLQLMAWYTLVFAVLLLFTGAFFYQHLENSLEAGLDTTLQVRAQQIASEVEVTHGSITLGDLTLTPTESTTEPQPQPLQRGNVDYGELVRLLSPQGKLLRETPAFSSLHVPQASITQAQQGNPWQGTLKVGDDGEIRIYSRALTQGGHEIAIIQVGESLTALHTLLHELIGELLLIGAFVLLVCAVGSYWLAARSFAPIQRLALAARCIKAGDLHQRVPVPAAHDEVQYLALTLNEMLDSLEQSFIRQRRFVADASHELRTPIAVLRNKAEVALLKTRSQADYEQVLQEVSAESERLGHLIGSLLALARGDEGRKQFEWEDVALDELTEMVVASAQPHAAERGVCVGTRELEPTTVRGDEARLIQAIMNLVDNAILYTNEGGEVTLSVKKQGTSAILTVHDTGIGIAPEHLPHLFERFYRVDQARQRHDRSSSGLGLSIVEWIVQMHGGFIAVESQPGSGSTFAITFPRPLIQ